MTADGLHVVVDAARATAVRERVGPTGWLVLEAFAFAAPPGRRVVEVRSSARSLAEVVRLSKDSVARALLALAEAGLVERVDHRDMPSGQFAPTTYRVDLGAAGITVLAVSQGRVTATNQRPTRVGDQPSDDQLSLLT